MFPNAGLCCAMADLLLDLLIVVHLRIPAAARQQFVVTATFVYFAMTQDDDLVSLGHC